MFKAKIAFLQEVMRCCNPKLLQRHQRDDRTDHDLKLCLQSLLCVPSTNLRIFRIIFLA